jgi:hypothetical protein
VSVLLRQAGGFERVRSIQEDLHVYDPPGTECVQPMHGKFDVHACVSRVPAGTNGGEHEVAYVKNLLWLSRGCVVHGQVAARDRRRCHRNQRTCWVRPQRRG